MIVQLGCRALYSVHTHAYATKYIVKVICIPSCGSSVDLSMWGVKLNSLGMGLAGAASQNTTSSA